MPPRPGILLSLVWAVGRRGGTLPAPARSPAVPAVLEAGGGGCFLAASATGRAGAGVYPVPGMLRPRMGLAPAVGDVLGARSALGSPSIQTGVSLQSR